MNLKRTFFVGVLSCVVVSTFFAAESGAIELRDFSKNKIVPICLDKGLLTKISAPRVELECSFWSSVVKIKNIFPGDGKNTLSSLMKDNYSSMRSIGEHIFCPLVLKYVKGQWFQKVFITSNDPELLAACRVSKKVFFYPYGRGLLAFSPDSEIGIDFFEKNGNFLRELLNESAKEPIHKS